MSEQTRYEQLGSMYPSGWGETVKRMREKLITAGIPPDGEVEIPSPEVYERLIETDFEHYAKLCLRHMMESEGAYLEMCGLGEIDTVDFSPSYCEEPIVIAKKDENGNWV